MRRVILYIAVSLDGMIAGPNDDLSFLHDYDDVALVKTSYDDLMLKIDTILLGRKTYDWVTKHMPWPYEGLKTIVFSRHPKPIDHGIMTDQNPREVIKQLKTKPGKDIWLIGGAELAQACLHEGLVDSMEIAIIPKLLGEGIQLFKGSKSLWDVKKIQEEKGLVLISYERKTV